MSELSFTKNVIAFNISREMAIMYGLIEPTDEERAEQERRSAEFHAEQVAARQTYQRATEHLNGLTDPVSVALVALHGPVEGDFSVACHGCDMDGYETEAPPWPCRTVRTIAEVSGIDLPDGDMPGTYYADRPQGDTNA